MNKAYIQIDVPKQTLKYVGPDGQLLEEYSVSTAANGVGEQNGSGCTPRGKHIIRAKIGGGVEANTVFVGRRQTSEQFAPDMRKTYPDRDWILTRILWLSGSEVGVNRLGDVDTMRRYVYIHGTPDDVKMGEIGSHGCIRMRNQDIVELFDQVEVGLPVIING